MKIYYLLKTIIPKKCRNLKIKSTIYVKQNHCTIWGNFLLQLVVKLKYILTMCVSIPYIKVFNSYSIVCQNCICYTFPKKSEKHSTNKN